jgi:hypothetical protein
MKSFVWIDSNTNLHIPSRNFLGSSGSLSEWEIPEAVVL